jgi:cellulose synthase (UDP-forming)
MENAVRRFARAVAKACAEAGAARGDAARALALTAAHRVELTPYAFHVSEDIYTSMWLHADDRRRWRSVYHPRALTRMLSPQDALAWTVQRFKYATGTLDIALRDNPIRLRGLTACQKLMYGATMYAYLAPLWTLPLMLAPLAFFYAGLTPVRAFDVAFWSHIFPFLVASRLALLAGTWGVATWRSEQYHLAAFWLNLRALGHVLARRPLRFVVTPKARSARRALRLAVPHLVLLGAMAVGLVWGGLRLDAHSSVEANAYVANVFWTVHNGACLVPFVLAALAPRRGQEVPA